MKNTLLLSKKTVSLNIYLAISSSLKSSKVANNQITPIGMQCQKLNTTHFEICLLEIQRNRKTIILKIFGILGGI